MVVRSVKVVIEADASPFVRGMAQASAAAQATGDRLNQLNQKTVSVDQSMETAGKVIAGFGAVTAVGLAASAKAAVEWESAFAGVKKTVDDNAAGYAQLSDELRDLSQELPASQNEIAGVAEAAGQLGVAREDITSFTETMIALGETTNLTSDQAATGIAQIANVMGTTGPDVERFGSALVALGNDGASTESQILDMSQRIAGVGAVVGLSEADILAFSNAVTSMGINAEAGGTSVSRVFTDMAKAAANGGEELNVFAETAGVSAAEFARSFEEDPAEAFASFISGLGGIQEAGGNVFGVLEDLGLSDTRVSQALLGMASSGDLLTDSLELGSKAWEENTALADEAGLRYETTAAKLQVAKNNLVDAAITVGEVLLPLIASGADVFAAIAGSVSELPDGAIIAGTAIAGVAAAMALTAGAALLLTPRINATRIAFAQLNTAFRGTKVAGFTSLLGPLGIAISAITIGLGYWATKQLDAAAAQEALQATLDDQTGAFGDASQAYALDVLEKEGALKTLQDLGVSTELITAAIKDEGDARKELRGILEADTEIRGQGNNAMRLQSEESEKAEGALKSLFGAYDDGTEAQERLNEATRRAAAYTPEAETAFRKMNAQIVEQDDALGGLNPALDENAAASEEAAEEARKWREEMAGQSAAFIDLTGALNDVRADEQAAAQEQADAYNIAATEHTEMVRKRVAEQVEAGEHTQEWADKQVAESEKATRTWEDYYDGQSFNLTTYLEELDAQVEAQQNWQANMLELSGKVSQGTLDELARLGPEGAPLVQALIDGSVEQLEDFDTLTAAKVGEAPDAWAQALQDGGPVVEAAFSQLGKKGAQKLVDEISSGELTVQEAIDKYDLVVDIDGDFTPAEVKTARLQAITAKKIATVLLDADDELARQERKDFVYTTGRTTATAKLNADPDEADDVLRTWFYDVKDTTGTAQLDGDDRLGQGVRTDFLRDINTSTGTLDIDAVTTKARDAFRTFIKDSDGKTIKVKFSNGNTALAAGGTVPGWSPNDTADNIPAMLTAEEEVTRAWSARNMRSKYPGYLEHINTYGRPPEHHAQGGRVGDQRLQATLDMDYLEGVLGGVGKSLTDAARKSYLEGGGGPKYTGFWPGLLAQTRAAGFNPIVTSTYRPGAVTATGVPSAHGLRKAYDSAPGSAEMRDWMWSTRNQRRETYLADDRMWLLGQDRKNFPGWQTIRRIHSFGYGNAHNHLAAYANGGKVRDIGAHDGEHVLTVPEVAAFGGHDRIYAARKAAMGQTKASAYGADHSFAIGGAVGQSYGQRYAAISSAQAAPQITVGAPSVGDIYVQNPWTGDYMRAEMVTVANGQIATVARSAVGHGAVRR